MKCTHILVDAREFSPDKQTGIGRFLEGLINCLVETPLRLEVSLACFSEDCIPDRLNNRKSITRIIVPSTFLKSEKALSNFTRQGVHLFISPYRKLPLFGVYSPSVHTIHDVFDLTQRFFRRRLKSIIDQYRLKRDLKRANLTWYDSEVSMEETRQLVGFIGKDARIRYLGLDERFRRHEARNGNQVLRKLGLNSGYILALGNGLPHKNWGVLLKLSKTIDRQLVFAGAQPVAQAYWKNLYPNESALWLNQISDDDLPTVMSGAFCVAQPSTAEGYGYPPLEAMACGVPAVISKIAVLVETTGGRALAADPHKPETWLACFQALENETYRQEQIHLGLQWVDKFRGRRGWRRHIADITELIPQLRGEERFTSAN
jgi:glycosyltransferase involved in cell wall biosynthesis